jgi:hypothetical protein
MADIAVSVGTNPSERALLLPVSVEKNLPAMVRTELAKLPPAQQSEFLEEYQRKAKSLGVSYLVSLLYCHYGYLGRWGMTVIMWLVGLVSFGVLGLIWWIVDLFRMPGLVRDRNRDAALEVLRNMKAIRS